jgi:hypothetical protein
MSSSTPDSPAASHHAGSVIQKQMATTAPAPIFRTQDTPVNKGQGYIVRII